MPVFAKVGVVSSNLIARSKFSGIQSPGFRGFCFFSHNDTDTSGNARKCGSGLTGFRRYTGTRVKLSVRQRHRRRFSDEIAFERLAVKPARMATSTAYRIRRVTLLR